VLGSIDLTRFVHAPFTPSAWIDFEELRTAVTTAVRLLDDVLDVTGFPLPEQAAEARGSRRLGLGVTGLADALVLLGVRYDSPGARTIARRLLATISRAAYRASIELARLRGPFPFFEPRYREGAFVRGLPEDIQQGIAAHGIRNSHIRTPEGAVTFALTDRAVALWRAQPDAETALPPAFEDGDTLTPREHLLMLGAVQQFVDGALAKTVNVRAACDLPTLRHLFAEAHELGC
jgi:ribonucleoside-diphosphate reductase alpha chain